MEEAPPDEPDWLPHTPDMELQVPPEGQTRRPQGPPCSIEVTFRRSPNREADLDRLSQIYELLCRYPGSDHFSLRVEANGQVWELSFPNDTTRYCAELEQDLTELLGRGMIRVDVAEVIDARAWSMTCSAHWTLQVSGSRSESWQRALPPHHWPPRRWERPWEASSSH